MNNLSYRYTFEFELEKKENKLKEYLKTIEKKPLLKWKWIGKIIRKLKK